MLGEYTVNYKKTHSQTLLPMLDEVAKMIELDLNSIDAIAVAAGPGSFTGLRIGSATAKRTWTGAGQTADPYSDRRCLSLQSVGTSVFDLSFNGRETAADLYRYL